MLGFALQQLWCLLRRPLVCLGGVCVSVDPAGGSACTTHTHLPNKSPNVYTLGAQAAACRGLTSRPSPPPSHPAAQGLPAALRGRPPNLRRTSLKGCCQMLVQGRPGAFLRTGRGGRGGALHHLETIPDLRLSLPAVLSPVLVPPPAVKKHTMNWNNTTTTQGNPLHVNRI